MTFSSLREPGYTYIVWREVVLKKIHECEAKCVCMAKAAHVKFCSISDLKGAGKGLPVRTFLAKRHRRLSKMASKFLEKPISRSFDERQPS